MELKHTASPRAFSRHVDEQVQVLLNKLYTPHYSHTVVNVADLRLYRATLKHVLESLDETACRLHSIIEWAEGEGLQEVTASQMEVFERRVSMIKRPLWFLLGMVLFMMGLFML